MARTRRYTELYDRLSTSSVEQVKVIDACVSEAPRRIPQMLVSACSSTLSTESHVQQWYHAANKIKAADGYKFRRYQTDRFP